MSMEKALSQTDIHRWALIGAEQRLLAIAEEARAIFAAFPELRAHGRGFDSQAAAAAPGAKAKAPSKRRRPVISAEGRQRIAAAQRARWARLKQAKTEGDKPKPAPAAPAKKPALAAAPANKPAARKGMSAAARKAQADRMRAYWAAKRKR